MSDDVREVVEVMTVPLAPGPGDGPAGVEMAAVTPPLGPGDSEPNAREQDVPAVQGPLGPGESETPATTAPMRVRPAARPGS